ncbi:MAG: hypothetical protein C0518_04620 [Opitutus sp.]|nr:hypothetical protein [Opitutus sp.]
MLRHLPAALLWCLTLAFATAAPLEIPSPAGRGSMGASLATGADGAVFLSWLEPVNEAEWTLQFSRFDHPSRTWSEARTIARGGDWFINWADFPSVTPLSERHLLAVWFVNNPAGKESAGGDHDHGAGYHAEYSLSDDGGATWSKPQGITGESTSTEFVAALALGENSRAFAAWLDGRDRAHNGGVQKLFAQTLLAQGPDALVDPSVCDCCQLALVRTGNDALLAYRGRTRDEVRDIRLARWRDGKWETPRPLHDDNWEISACPVNGPRLAARGAHVAAVWFTGAQSQPRVQAKISRDGGQTFGDAVRLDLGRPQGRVDAAVLADGSAVFTWLEMTGREPGHAGGIYARRVVAVDGAVGEPQLLAPTSTARASGFPRLVLLDDRHALLAYTAQSGESRVATLLIELK